MENMILSPIPVKELIDLIRCAVKEEIAKHGIEDIYDLTQRPATEKELCEYLGITSPTVSRLRKKRIIPFMEIGSHYRYDLKKVVNALEKSKELTNLQRHIDRNLELEVKSEIEKYKMRERNKKSVENLDDRYVVKNILKQTKKALKTSDIPKDIIDLKRNSLKLKREIYENNPRKKA